MTNRKALYTFGRKRKPDYVRVVSELVDGTPCVRVYWMERGRRRVESFHDTRNGKAEAKAFAEGKHEALQTGKSVELSSVTLVELWEKYVTAKVDAWRPATLTNKTGRWSRFLLFVPGHTPATDVTREMLDEYKRALLTTPTKHKRPRSVYQVRQHIDLVTALFRWAMDRNLIPPTKVATYQPEFSKDAKKQIVAMAEYSAEERAKVLAQFDPRDARAWRPWVLTTLFAYCGPRQSAARSLEWRDVDLDAGLIHWRGELDKMATDRHQPMPAPVREALWVAYGWRIAAGYTGPFVFFRPAKGLRDLSNGGYVTARSRRRAEGAPDTPYAYASYLDRLHEAEKVAGVGSVKYRGAHGFRRGIAGDVHARTGSSKSAADWIGDKSVKVVERHYLLERADELRKTADLVSTEATDDEQ